MKYLLLILFLVSPIFGMSQGDYQRHYQKGMKYYSRGIYEKAIICFRNAEKASTKNYEINRACKGLADSYKAVSDNFHALACYERLVPFYKGENLNLLILNMSDLWNQTGQYFKTIEKLESMVTKYEEIRLNNLSVAYLRTGQERRAIDIFSDIISRKDSATLAGALQNKGYAQWSIGNFADAALLLNSAASKYSDRTNNKYICLGNTAIVYSELGNYNKALELIDKAIDWQYNNLGTTNSDFIISLRKKAEILLSKGDSIGATAQFKNFFELERDYVANNFAYMSENERINYWHTQKPLLDECFATENINPDFLFDVAVFSKSVLTQSNRNFTQIVSHDSHLSPLYDSLLTIRNMIRSASAGERKSLVILADKVEKQLMDNMPNLKRYVKDLQISGDDIRRSLKNDNDIVVEFVYYPKNGKMYYAALVMRKNSPVKFVPLFSSSEIEDFKINKFYTVQECINEQNSDNSKSFLYTDTILSNKVWRNIIIDVPTNSNVYFVPDGIFHSWAIEYMPTVHDRIKMHRLSSSRILCRHSQIIKQKNILLVGGLNYDDTTSVRSYQDTIPNRLGSKRFGSCDNCWNYLHGSKSEIDSIGKIFEIDENSFITGGKGTEEFVKENLGKYQIALFSTHGYYKMNNSLKVVNKYILTDIITEDQSMSLCGLVLSGVNITMKNDSTHSKMEDGLLTALEISELDLSRLDLIVLSACQTNLGKITQDGVFNLPRGLKKGGANSLLVSLWKVDDAATSKLMSTFFTNLKSGLSKYDSLRNAQKQLMKCDNRPYYWAPFVLIDDI